MKNKKNYKSKKVIKLISIFVSLVTTIIVAVSEVIQASYNRKKEGENVISNQVEETVINGVAYDGDGGSINSNIKIENISGDKVISNQWESVANNTIIKLREETDKELLLEAATFCSDGEYDRARVLYERGEIINYKSSLINLGYIYAKGLSIVGMNYGKAEEYYKMAGCIEAKRNLLALYLYTYQDQQVMAILSELFDAGDKITMEYLCYCLYNMSLEEYCENSDNEINISELNIEDLYNWEYDGGEYRGYNPPANTVSSRWIFSGIDFDSEYSTPYAIYKRQSQRYTKGVNMLEQLYYEEDGILYAIKN